MKVKAKELTDEQRIATLDALYTAAGAVKGRADMKLFLRDLLTESERIMLGRRILIARYLLSGVTYDHIVDQMHVSNRTVANVERWLDDQFPGYEKAIRELNDAYAKRSKKRDDAYMFATSAMFRLKKKYPIHFLLFPWPKRK
jgi:uncharacterized protein YerC